MGYVIDVVTLCAVMAIAVHGYMLIKGLGGLLNLGHAVFYGLGAYTAAILATRVLPPGTFPIALVAGALAAAGGAYLIGWPALKERGRYFMIVTFAIQLVFVNVVINLSITGGPDGISSIPRMSFGPWQMTSKTALDLGPFVIRPPHINLILILAMAVASYLLCRHLVRSPYGRLVRATREDELAVEAYGRATMPVKLSILAIGAGVTGAAGAIFAHYFNYVGPSQFELNLVVLFLMMLILGGQYSLVGATVGTVAMIVLLEALRYALENVLHVPFTITAHMREVVFSVVLILVLVVRPNGMFPERFIAYGIPDRGVPPDVAPASAMAAKVAPESAPPAEVARLPSAPGVTPPILSCVGLEKRFGGLAAVNGAGFDLIESKILAIIGPNGAGKTTVFNMLSGFVTPDAGEVFARGRRITGMAPDRIATLGIARTFQDVRVWQKLTAIENILAVTPNQPGEHPFRPFLTPGAVRRAETANVEYAWGLLERFGLADKANQLAGQLSYAQRKMLALARLTAFRPEVVLLDEPTAGVDPKRLDTFLRHIRSFADQDGKTICLIEHNMTVVRELADWVLFMEEGRVMAGGRPEDVLGDRALMASYLGQAEAMVG